MADPITGIAAVSSIAAIGFKAYGDYEKGSAQKSAYDFQSDQEKRQADYARLRANQIGAHADQEMATTLANIDAVRAAANTDPSSPTGIAFKEGQANRMQNQKNILVDNAMEDARQKDADARYLRETGNFALLQGRNAGMMDIFSGVSTGLFNFGRAA